MSRNTISVVRLGRISYSEGIKQQALYTEKIRQSTQDSSKNYLLLLEHNPVYTVGIRSNTVSPAEEVRLRGLGADFHRTSRGGLITFHGPGQLVAYPICALRELREGGGVSKVLGVRRYVDLLEESIICTSRALGVHQVGRVDGLPGVWVAGKRKVASLGVSVQHGITGHGLALNCNVDLAWFSKIVACGIKGVEVTSLSKETQADHHVEDVLPIFMSHFCNVFGLHPTDVERHDHASPITNSG